MLLYLFIWRIVRSASRDIIAPNESFVLAPGQAQRRLVPERAPGPTGGGRLVIVRSPTLPEGEEHRLNGARSTSAAAARTTSSCEATASRPRATPCSSRARDGVWLEDVGSTNGTFVNGIRLERARKLASGDVVRVGETDLRYEL